MNLPQPNTSLFNRLRFILVETSHPGNIGACARALKTMGFGANGQLFLVNPRFADALQDPEAVAFASGAQDVLQAAQIVDSVEQALLGCNFAAAVSARLREFSPPILTPRALATHLQSAPDLQAAIIFGNERYGLPNQVVQNANVLVNIPANPAYSSLNLAQAAQVVAYECRIAADEPAASANQTGAQPGNLPTNLPGFQGQAASLAQIDGMYAHLQEALIALGFLDANNPRKLMPRLKRLFGRTQLETEEVNILRGIAGQILARQPKNPSSDHD